MTTFVQGCAGYAVNPAQAQTRIAMRFEHGCAGCAGFRAHARVRKIHQNKYGGKMFSRVDHRFNPAHPAHPAQHQINQGFQPIRVSA